MANTTTKNQALDLAHAPKADAAMTIGSDNYRGALEPKSTGEAFEIAQMMAAIRYCGVETPAEALGRIMTGRGLGLSAMQSLRGIYTVHGRPGIDASLMQALCLASPLCEKFSFVPDESDDSKATFIAKRRGDEAVKHTFTIEDAERMGVVDRGADEKAKKDNNWFKVRKAMLRARAKSELARLVFPDLIFGMYSREELEEAVEPRDPRRDPNEMAGEIVDAEEAAAEPKIAAAARDYQAEANELIAQARAAKTRADGAAFRTKFEAWDGIEPFRAQVEAAYNEAKKAAREAAQKQPAAGTAPAPVPEGNLFAGAADKGTEQP